MVFNIFKKAKVEILAPVDGQIVALDEVPDPVFSQRMMGEGVAVVPSKGNIHAPVDGTVILVAATKHAIGIRAKDGTEILIHVGLETVALNGEGFSLAVSEGDRVTAGQVLMGVDWEYIRTRAKSAVTPIVITNNQNNKKQVTITKEKDCIQGKTVIITA
ncbi:PTS glucose transporter subunit IIA [Bacillus sp. MRMR6]|uniref:PTS sugar transporter subunit IIA n=1 Tax=Bacillus sp. MRMR6 TaxID=1928617 RepID=UPI0009532771|nr:PTS glucose transporter subunit IIA [Bacillus sp. MRMR6]OLS40995.1 PTS glucose transporter subunit IIA [Bacillus sp. MRMR6]